MISMIKDQHRRTTTVILVTFLLLMIIPICMIEAQAEAGDICVVSTSSSGGYGNNTSRNAIITGDGRYVVFSSSALDLVPNDTNGFKDIFRKDLESGETVRCSTSSDGSQANGQGWASSITPDGRFVTFISDANNLVSGDTNGFADAFRKDLQTGVTVRCSTSASSVQGNGSTRSRTSPDSTGRYVLFSSDANNLTLGDHNGVCDVFRKDLVSGEIINYTSTGNGDCFCPYMSSDAQHVTFTSGADNLIPGDTNGKVDIFYKNLKTGSIMRCSTLSSGEQSNGESYYTDLSEDGRCVAFVSEASNLVPGDTNGAWDVFQKDLETGETIRCSTSATGEQGNGQCRDLGDYFYPTTSQDGRYVVFSSSSSNLIANDNNGTWDVFCKDVQTEKVLCCSKSNNGILGNNASSYSDITPDAKHVVLSSCATNLVPGKTNGIIDVYRKELEVTPKLSSISPSSGAGGATVQVNGTNFGSTQSSSYVTFGSTKVTDYVGWSDQQITCYVPSGLSPGACKVKVVTAYGTSNTVDFTVTSPIDPDYPYPYYLAEGCTRSGFSEWLCLQNYQDSDVGVKIVYMLSTGENIEQVVTLAPYSRWTVDVNSAVGPDRDLSCAVYASEPIVVERPMYFIYKAGEPGYGWAGGHDVVAPSSLSDTYYFAEGTCRPGFDPYICVQNPNPTEAQVTVEYMLGDGTTVTESFTVGAAARHTVTVKDTLGEADDYAHDFSAVVRCTNNQQILCERPMYFYYSNWVPGGHDVVGSTYLATTFYFAEGCTWEPGGTTNSFNTFLCLGNPSDQDAEVTVTYMVGEGQEQPDPTTHTVGANSRSTVTVNSPEEADKNKDVSIKVDSTTPIIVERPMYFFQSDRYKGGSDAIGTNQPYRNLYFAEGTTRSGFEEWLCLQNPGDTVATVTITYMFPNGGTMEQVVQVEPDSRWTVDVNSVVGSEQDVSCRVSSDVPIVAERPMYFDFSGYNGGSDVMGDPR